MKLLLTMNLPYTRVYGGANRSNRLLAEGLAARGHRMRVVVPACAHPSPATFEESVRELSAEGRAVSVEDGLAVYEVNGVEVHAVAEQTRQRAYLIEQIKSFEPDVTLVSSEDASQNWLDAALKVCPARVVYLAHTPQMLPFGPESLYPGGARKELIGRAAGVVTISKFVADYIKRWAGFESFTNHPPHYGDGPFPDYGRFDEGYVLLMNASRIKGITILLSLARAMPEVQFATLPGYGTTSEDLSELRALPNVTLLRNSKNIEDILCRTRILLMPTLWMEGFGMAAVDVMLRGIPVLASDHGGLTEAKLGTDFLLPVSPIVRFEERLDESLLPTPVVPEQDTRPWLEALRLLTTDRALYERQSRAAREAATKFVSGLSLAPLEDYLRRVADAAERAPAKTWVEPAKALAAAAGGDSRTHVEPAQPAGEKLDDLSALTPEQLSLLTLRLRKKKGAAAGVSAPSERAASTIPHARRDEPPPLSFAQQRLWFLDQLEPGCALYNLPSAVRLHGRLDIAALERTLGEVVRRHEVLRTTFEVVGEQPRQVIHPPSTFRLAVIDLSSTGEEEREAEAARLLTEEARRPFDLSRDLMLRSSLLKLGEQDYLVLFTLHHIASDGWSTGVLVKELAALYEAYSKGEESPLKELPVQYADYAAWQKERLQGEVLEEQLGYWKRQLNELSRLELPTDRPRPAVQSFRGAHENIELGKELSEALKGLSRREGVTLYMALLAGWQALLCRYTGQEDIVVGAPVASRTRAELESLIGFFVNTLVLRTDLRGGVNFVEALRRVREVVAGAQANQDVPFEKLVEELQPERRLSHTPLFQVVFSLDNVPRESLQLPGLSLSFPRALSSAAKFDLTFAMQETGDQVYGSLTYNKDLFETATVRRMLRHFRLLLESAVASPTRPLADLRLLSREEERRLLEEWNETATSYPRESPVHRLFEEQAALTPDAVAVVFQDLRLTYRELNERANRLARRLVELGVRAEARVGLCLERSAEMVVALLAILKAGAAYVPLDVQYPHERLAFMLADSQVSLLLTDSSLLGRLPQNGARVLCLDAEDESVAGLSCEDLRVGRELSFEPVGDSLAYIIYTSGSTGVPKGVGVPHRAVVRLVRETSYINFGASEVFLQLAPVSFDASTLELWGSLLNGARLVVMPPHTPTLEELGAALKDHGVTTLWLTAGLFSLMAEEQPEALCGVRQLLAGGDVLPVSQVRKLLAAPGERALINGYGPTENTTFTCCHRMKAGEDVGGTVPIGRPISNTRVYVLDERLRPTPVGVAGELYAAGDGLARGYHDRPELTAERFIPDPYGREPGARMYRTGDVVRYRPDGSIEFMGRRDGQVKLRGYRVEVGEVESALCEQPCVKEAVVLVRGEGSDKRLVAYVVGTAEGVGLSAGELRRGLKERLPEHMVPSAFVLMDEFPLTANGKIDRGALPEPEPEHAAADEYAAALTPTEELLTGVWEELLGVGRVGGGDNFFDLGGHSLLATQVVTRLRSIFRVELALRTIFESPTVAELAARIDDASKSEHADIAPPIQKVSRDGVLPLSFAQQRLWFLDQLEPESAAYNMPAAVRMRGDLDIPALERTLSEVVRRHEVLRTTFETDGEQPRQVIHPPRPVTLAVTDLGAMSEAEREAEAARLAAEESRRPFDLARGPMLRSSLLRLGERDHVVLFTLHHIAADGWSMGVLVKEVAALYEAYTEGLESPLEELPIQYADYAAWQKERLQGEALEAQLGYWKRQLSGLPTLELPTDRPRPTTGNRRGAQLPIRMSRELSEKLKELSRREGATLFMTLLASWQVLLWRLAGQRDVVVGTDVANRTSAETESLIGFFVNQLVMRAEVEEGLGFGEFLGRVRTASLGAYAHQDVPFEKVVEMMRPEREGAGGRTPLFQAKLVVQSAGGDGLRMRGVEVEPLPLSLPSAKFDVLLHLFDTGREIIGSLQYNADIFDASSMALMQARFETLLHSIVERSDARLDELEFLTMEEREQREAEKVRREKASIQRFKSIKSRTISVPTDDVPARTEQR